LIVADVTPGGTVQACTPSTSNVIVWVGGLAGAAAAPDGAAAAATDPTTRPSAPTQPDRTTCGTVTSSRSDVEATPGGVTKPTSSGHPAVQRRSWRWSSVDAGAGQGGHLPAMNRPCTPVIIIL
jgi:hypothetical protein